MRWICGACGAYRPDEVVRREFRGWASGYVLLTLLGIWALRPGAFGGPLLLVFIQSALLSGLIVSAVHEAAHAAAAVLVRIPVTQVTLGRGPPIAQFKARGIPVTIGRYSFLGAATHVAWPPDAERWRIATVLAAGPLSNLVLGLAVFATAAVLSTGREGILTDAALAVGSGTGVSQVAACLFNLWPHGRSDGRLLLALLGRRGGDGDPVIKTMAEAQMLELSGRTDAAAAKALEAWNQRPSDNALSSYLLHLLAKASGPDTALAFFRQHRSTLEAARDETLEATAYFDVNVADAALRADPPDLELADSYSERALQAAPDHTAMLATRGLMLMRRGDADAGRSLLLRAARLELSPQNKALFCEDLARIARERGDHAEAAAFGEVAARTQHLSTGSGPA